MIAWTDVEDAIRALVVTATELDEAKVIWSRRPGPRPAAPWVSLSILAIERFGQDWVDVEDNPAPAAGEEILEIARGSRTLTVSIQAFGGQEPGDEPEHAPIELLEAVMAEVAFTSSRWALNAAGVGLLGFGPVQAVDGFLNSGGIGSVSASLFEPRAALEARFSLASQVSRPTTYIQSAEISREGETPPITVPGGVGGFSDGFSTGFGG
jgi:hypothetical protein